MSDDKETNVGEPVQEPLFWYKPHSSGMYNGPIHNAQIGDVLRGSEEWAPLYTTPQQRTAAEGEDTRRAWVGLTDQERQKIHFMWAGTEELTDEQDVINLVEDWLKEKNTRNGGCL